MKDKYYWTVLEDRKFWGYTIILNKINLSVESFKANNLREICEFRGYLSHSSPFTFQLLKGKKNPGDKPAPRRMTLQTDIIPESHTCVKCLELLAEHH